MERRVHFVNAAACGTRTPAFYHKSLNASSVKLPTTKC